MALDFLPYGAQFFRPPNPPRQDWRRDMQRLVDHGLNVIKLWPMWTWIHRAPDVFDFSEIDELMDLAQEYGLHVIINTILENSPYWLEERYPEARYQTADGYICTLQPRSNTAVGGWPGLCLDHPAVRAEAGAFLRQIASRYADHPALFAYDIWNEPHLEPAAVEFKQNEERNLYCYCDSTIADFRKWLERRYGSLEGLCDAWVHRYTSWSHVYPPRRRECYQDMIDWRIYMTENLAMQMAWRAEQIRQHDTTHRLMTHVWGPMSANGIGTASIDPWKLAESVDMFGVSLFPRWWWKEYDLVRFAFHLDGTMAGSKGKPFWISELQGGCGLGLMDGIRRPPTPSPEEVWVWNWMGLAHGMDGLMYWQWRSERLGTEAPGFGLLNVAGEPTARAAVAARMAGILGEHEALFLNAKPPVKQVAIIQDPYSMAHNFAAEGDNSFYTQSCMGYYRALWEAGIPVDFLHSEREIDAGQFANAKLLVLPLPQAMKQQTAERLKQFVADGGVLWADACPAHYDQLGRCSEIVPGWGLDEVFGAREQDVYVEETLIAMDTDACEMLGWSKARRVQGYLYAETLLPTDGHVVGHWHGQPAIVCKRYGKGLAILNGTYFGIGLSKNFNQPTADLLLDVVRQCGIRPPLMLSSPDTRGYLLQCSDYAIAILFNMTAEKLATRLEVPGKIITAAKDLVCGDRLCVVEGRIETDVPRQGVRVIHLKVRTKHPAIELAT